MADTFRCGAHLVEVGTSAEQVRALCGSPAEEDEATQRVVVEPSHQAVSTVVTSTWVYDRGPRRLRTILEFRDGLLTAVRTNGYGYGHGEAVEEPEACARDIFPVGTRGAEIIAQCGEPSEREVWRAERLFEHDGVTLRAEGASWERWSFDLGPRRLVRVFVLVDGTLVESSTESYGK